jgi:hypothetical protein
MASDIKALGEQMRDVCNKKNISAADFKIWWKNNYIQLVSYMYTLQIMHTPAGRLHPFMQCARNPNKLLEIIIEMAEIAHQEEMETCLDYKRFASRYNAIEAAIDKKLKTKFTYGVIETVILFGYTGPEHLPNFFQMFKALRRLLKPTPAFTPESKIELLSPTIKAPAAGVNDVSEEFYIDLLPSTPMPPTLLTGTAPPLLEGIVTARPAEEVLREHKRSWFNGVRVAAREKHRITPIIDHRGKNYSDFTLAQHAEWAKEVAENTAICSMGEFGFGVFVPLGKQLKKGVIIPATGTILFDLEQAVIGPKYNSRAAAVFNPKTDTIIGLVDPHQAASTWDFTNHGFPKPQPSEISCIGFYDPQTAKKMQFAKLMPVSRFYNGIEISCLEVIENIEEGEQLLWPYLAPQLCWAPNGKPLPGGIQPVLFNREGGLLNQNKFYFETTTLIAKKNGITYSTQIRNWFWSFLKCMQHIGLQGQDAKGNYWLLKVPVNHFQKIPTAGETQIDISSPDLPEPCPITVLETKSSRLVAPGSAATVGIGIANIAAGSTTASTTPKLSSLAAEKKTDEKLIVPAANSRSTEEITALANNSAGIAEFKKGDFLAAEKFFKKSLAYWETQPTQISELQKVKFSLGSALLKQKESQSNISKLQEAEKYLKEASDLQNKTGGNKAPKYEERLAICQAEIRRQRALLMSVASMPQSI